MNRHYFRRASIAYAGALLVTACWRWTPSPVTPRAGQGVPELGHVRVGHCAGDTVELYSADWRADTLAGIEQLPHTGAGSKVPRAVPGDSVCKLERRTVNVGATVALTAGITVVALFFVAILLGGLNSAGSGF